MAALPLAAAVVAAAFAVGCLRLVPRGGGAALAVWGIALVQFTVASAALAWGIAFGWSSPLYRTYYLFGAVLNVAWLGLGTIWLLSPRSAGWIATALLIAATAYATAVVGLLPLGPTAGEALAAQRIPSGSAVMPPEARALSRWFSISGSVVVLAGLAWSVLRRRAKAPGLLLLAGGVVVVALASELARLGFVVPFSVGLAVGVSVMYLGFRRTV